MKPTLVDVATLSDAIENAARVAPTRGDAAQKTPGIQFVSDGDRFEIMATDIASTYRQRIYPDSHEPCRFTLPSKPLAAFFKQIDVTAKCEITHKDDAVHIECDSTTLSLQVIDKAPFKLPRLDRKKLGRVDLFAQAVNHVSWAAEKDQSQAISGVHLDGTHVVATDKHRMAMDVLECPVEQPVTVPLTSVAPALRGSVEVEVGATKNRLMIMPDTDTEITSVIIHEPFPQCKPVVNKSADLTMHEFHVDKKQLGKALSRVNVLANTEQTPAGRFELTSDVLTITTRIPGFGDVSDSLDVELIGDCGDLRTGLSTTLLRSVIDAAEGDMLKIFHGGATANVVRFGDATPSWVALLARISMTEWEQGHAKGEAA